MRHPSLLAMLGVALVASVACERRASFGRVVWHDEFDGPAGATFDRAKWTADTGGAGFGNRERQFYTTRPENVALDGRGHLMVTLRTEPSSTSDQCWYGQCRYSSARLKTQGLFTKAYGRFEARIRVPRGRGLWPAFWMLGANMDSVGWPRSGEVDIMENRGREPRIVYGTAHGPGYSGDNGIGGADTLRTAASNGFHVYAVEWQPDDIRWFVDDRQYFRLRPGDLPHGAKWVFDHPFFLLMNVAFWGAWGGDPDTTTALPQTMMVDYVRVFDRS
ncbi:MAG TPA: glycoside hydrolase family 16 protein [Gemmatimonadaceae bacterium]